MESTRLYTREELKEAALHDLITSRVDSRMISYLATAADAVIPCDKNMMPAQQSRKQTSLPTPPTTPELRAVSSQDPILPSVEQFIRQLVRSSNVQAATLMPTLIYLQRLKNKLQPMSRGLRCTSHRIFLACLILAAKYVNDISPKNKHWARYTNMEGPSYQFGFCTSEVNLMEKQLLQLLDFDLRFSEEDLHTTWQDYLEPKRQKLEDDNRRTYFAWQETAMRAAAAAPQYSPRYYSQYDRYARASSGSVSPPALSYASSSASSTSSRPSSRATTPTSVESVEYTAMYTPSQYSGYEYPTTTASKGQRKRLLPYEITAEQAMAHSIENRTTKIPRASRGVFSRVFGNAMTAR